MKWFLSRFPLEKHSVDRKAENSGPRDGAKRRTPVAPAALHLPFPVPISTLRPRYSRRPDQEPLRVLLLGLERQGPPEQREEASGRFASLSEWSRVREGCQETCAMSLTRVWMSCRHRGHVSSCKAHSMHIPLGGGGKKRSFSFEFITAAGTAHTLVFFFPVTHYFFQNQ